MSKILQANNNEAKAIAIPQLFSENTRAKYVRNGEIAGNQHISSPQNVFKILLPQFC